MTGNVASGAQPTFVDALGQAHGKAHLLPRGRGFILGLYQPRCVGDLDVLFVSPPATSVLETRSEQQPAAHQRRAQSRIRRLKTQKPLVFLWAQKSS